MIRRQFIKISLSLAALPPVLNWISSAHANSGHEKIEFSSDEWQRRLTPAQYDILRLEGTEPAYTSSLLKEKRAGLYVCAGCEHPLFISDMKYESGTGWPSFKTSIDNHLDTKTDFKLLWPRTEYHCARCGGHQGHIFNDGPAPLGKRWCNNGLALKFIAGAEYIATS